MHPCEHAQARLFGHQVVGRRQLRRGVVAVIAREGRLLAARGLPVLDADLYAREALAAGTPAARAVLERHGERVRAAGTDPAAAVIDRAALGRIV